MKKLLSMSMAILLMMGCFGCSKTETIGGSALSDVEMKQDIEENVTSDKTKKAKKTALIETDEEAEETAETVAGKTTKKPRTTRKKTTPTIAKPTEGNGAKTVTVGDLLRAGQVQILGRTHNDGGNLQLTYSNAGIRLYGKLSGDVWLDTTASINGAKLNIVIDGASKSVKTMNVSGGDSSFRVASDLTAGMHTVEITNGTATNYCKPVITGITYTGTLQTPPVAALQIECIGDSITCGEGAIGDYSVAGHNGYNTYIAQTARNLQADVSVIAACGAKIDGMYTQFKDPSWDFAAHHRDIVVINLGTNDFGWSSTPAAASIGGMADLCEMMLYAVREKYGKDTYIIWAYGMMFDKDVTFVKNTVNAYATKNKDNKVLFCDLSSVKDNKGYSQHPSQKGHDAAATLLTAFIRSHCADILK